MEDTRYGARRTAIGFWGRLRPARIAAAQRSALNWLEPASGREH
jgi:hypothetical protein